MGLVSTVTADDAPWDGAKPYAAKLTERSRQGLAEMKRLAREGLSLEPRLAMRLETDAASRHILGPDTGEGLAAFQARRKPNTHVSTDFACVRSTDSYAASSELQRKRIFAGGPSISTFASPRARTACECASVSMHQ